MVFFVFFAANFVNYKVTEIPVCIMTFCPKSVTEAELGSLGRHVLAEFRLPEEV
jgi:hypothetical protein